LTEAALAAFAWTKLKIAVAVVLAACVLGGSAGFITHRLWAESRSAGENGAAAPNNGRKTLADRQDGLPPMNKQGK
jgi:hypothetical protein